MNKADKMPLIQLYREHERLTEENARLLDALREAEEAMEKITHE